MPSGDRIPTWTVVVLCALGLTFTGLVSTASGSTVVPMTLQTLSDHAGQVIVGQVASVRSYWAEDPRRIESEVTFEDVEYLKGKLQDSTPTFFLTVPGGTVGRMSMQVCCAPSFAVGDRWVLFLLPTYKTHPVAGLYQGAFLIRSDTDGVERVYHARHDALEPVVQIDEQGFVRVAGPRGCIGHPHLVAANHARLKADQATREQPKAIAYEEFVAQIKPVLEHSLAHRLTGPAGRHTPVGLIAVPLKPSPGQRGAPSPATIRTGPVQRTDDKERNANARRTEARR